MKIAVISDIHSNIYALEAVLDDIKNRDIDLVACTGDLVGYGTRPNEVINTIRKNRILTIENQKNQNIIFPPQKTLPDPVSSISRNNVRQIKQVSQINLRKTINYGQVKQNEETPLTKKDKIVSYYINKKNDLLYSVLGDEMQKLTNKIYINTESNINDY